MFNKKKEFKAEPIIKEPIVEVKKPIVKEEPKVKAELKASSEVKASNIDEKVIDGKLYKPVSYMENGCSKSRLEEIK